MSYKGTDIENKAVDETDEQAREATIPEVYRREFTKFSQVVASEDEIDTLDAAQVRFHELLRKMSTLRIYVPPRWADMCNACGAKAGNLRIAAFQRRTR